MRAIAVIGAGFGDEGKGLMTDYFARQVTGPVANVRFNGGAQAGHTVVTSQGSHVFSHLGSGALAGADTYLSKHFVSNPELWQIEMEELGGDIQLYADPEGLLTTPYDVALNRALEQLNQHGSCGCGVWETVVRGKTPYVTRVGDDWRALSGTLEAIRKGYVAHRWREASGGLTLPPYLRNIIENRQGIDEYLNTWHNFHRHLSLAPWPEFARRYYNVIFEGAQGLLLDQNNMEFFPHVSASSTGLKNVRQMLQECNFRWWELEAVYVTRSYMTRHGNGAFPTEDPNMKFEDNTNLPNPWQGRMRFGELDMNRIQRAIYADLLAEKFPPVIYAQLAVTHLDQKPDFPRPAHHPPVAYKSFGPRACDVIKEEK